jgi:thiosulfate/3-mercaptopyruvate sulfurtransferase
MILSRQILSEPEEVYKHIKDGDDDILLIDVRRNEEYAREHIPNAVSLPLTKVIESTDIPTLLELFAGIGLIIGKDSKSVVVYDDTFGALAARVAWTLEYLGYENVSLLAVTYSKWKDLGFEVEHGSEGKVSKNKNKVSNENDSSSLTVNVTNVNVNVNKNIIASYEYIKSIIDGSIKDRGSGTAAKLLDVRERLNYLDHHIPTAINIPWKAFSAEDRVLKDKAEILDILKSRRIEYKDEVIVYCGSVGTLSGLSYYGLRLVGYSNVRLYANSLKEWRSLNLPLGGFKDAHYWDLSAE